MRHGMMTGVMIGIASAIATFQISLYALAYTAAIAMPHGFPTGIWDVFVLFGPGAWLVALVIHGIALRMVSVHIPAALLAFVATCVVGLAVIGSLHVGGKTLLAWTLGAGLASWWVARGRRRKPGQAMQGT